MELFCSAQFRECEVTSGDMVYSSVKYGDCTVRNSIFAVESDSVKVELGEVW